MLVPSFKKLLNSPIFTRLARTLVSLRQNRLDHTNSSCNYVKLEGTNENFEGASTLVYAGRG